MLDYKHINIPLVGEDGNAFSIMARVQKAMQRDGCTSEEITEVLDEMKKGNYSHLLNTVMEIFSIDDEEEEEDEDYWDYYDDYDDELDEWDSDFEEEDCS